LAQPGSKMGLLVGQGEIDVRGRINVARSVLGKNQAQWYAFWIGDIPAEFSVTIPVYGPNPGYNLYFGGGLMSCNADVPQRIVPQILLPGYPWIAWTTVWYKLQADIKFPEPCVFEVGPLGRMQFILFNEDTEVHNFAIATFGMTEKIV
ncbi:unnamed protein product, partial [marine sediment metagenome]